MHAGRERARLGRQLRSQLGIGELLLVASVFVWWAWALASRLWTDRPVPPGSPYLVAPLVLLGGVLAGRLFAARALTRIIPWVLLAGAVGFLFVDIYANAAAAVGVQLIALGGLAALVADDSPRRLRPEHAAATGLVVVGLMLASRSSAALVVGVPLAVVVVGAVALRRGPRRLIIATVSMVLMTLAATVIVWLASVDSWPGWLNESNSLSHTRHELWSDALHLWAANPLGGGGAGSFLDASAVARSRPDLGAAHSSVLQIGSELGLVGILGFVGLIAGAVAMTVQARHAAALVGVAAWTGLGIHSVIDHLYEFPAVMLAAGLVLGWASALRDPG